VRFKFGETVLGYSFDFLAKTLVWLSMVFISTTAAWFLVFANMMLFPASLTSFPPFAKVAVLALACKILCFSTCLAQNSGTETRWKNGYGSRNITSKLNESVKEKANPEVFFFYDKHIIDYFFV
jgi:hypothetical protein